MKILNLNYISLLFLILWLGSCQEPEIERPGTEEFLLPDYLKIELVAAEPDVILPVAMTQDTGNRLWIVEMPGYMRDINGSGEDIADGRIVILEDLDHDGYFESRKIFLDKLLNPRTICHVYGGILYSDGVRLIWTENIDDQPGRKTVVDSNYILGGNIEHQPNGLYYNIDNWIYSSKSDARYQMKNGDWVKEATDVRGQWGLSADSKGRFIYNHNSAPLIGDRVLPNVLQQNPHAEIDNAYNQYLTNNMRIYPIQATSVNRGYQDSTLDKDGVLVNYTSACAPSYIGSDALGSRHNGGALVCAPEANLISIYQLNDKDLDWNASQDNHEKNILASKDESFRPVNLLNGFDEKMYIVDLRKGIIQHSAYMSSYLREKILEKGLDKINKKGRIYRLSPKDGSAYYPKLNQIPIEKYAYLLKHRNQAVRLEAQKILVHHKDAVPKDSLIEVFQDESNKHGQLHALWTLEGIDKLTVTDLSSQQSTMNETLAQHMIWISVKLDDPDNQLPDFYRSMESKSSKNIDYALASTIGIDHSNIWFNLAEKYGQDSLFVEALVSSIGGKEKSYLRKLNKKSSSLLIEKIKQTIDFKNSNEINIPQIQSQPITDNRTDGLVTYKNYCSNCHGFDGKGLKNMAPSLVHSEIINGEESNLVRTIFGAYESNREEYQIPMPKYINDPNMDKEKIYNLVNYLKSSYSSSWSKISMEQIETIRDSMLLVTEQ